MTAAAPFTATIIGSPRIGPNRELKRAVEKYWAGRIDRAELESVAATLRRDTWESLVAAGLDSVPVNTFSYYDHVLDTAVLVGALPARVADIADDLDRYFAAARGNDDVAPLEMTKWFDTNYHYLVPEIDTDTRFSLNPAKVLGELKEARAQGIPARPVVVGPITFLALAKAVGGSAAPITRLDDLIGVYAELLGLLAEQGVDWVQLDEPVLVTDILETAANAAELAGRTYGLLGGLAKRPALFVASYFGELTDALPALARTPVEAIGVDLVAGGVSAVAAVPELAGKTVVAGIVDGRNVWRTDLAAALGTLATLLGSAGGVAVSTSCSTLHVPYSLDAEPDIDAALRSWLAFGFEKVTEVVTLARGLKDGREAIAADVRRVQCCHRVTSRRPAAEQRPDSHAHRHDRRLGREAGARGAAPRGSERTVATSRPADHDHRVLPADIGHPRRACGAAVRRDRRRRVRTADEGRDRGRC